MIARSMLVLTLFAALLAPAPTRADTPTPTDGSAPARTLEETSASARADLERALKELSALRDEISAGKLALHRKMSALEVELTNARGGFQEKSRSLDERNLGLGGSQTEIRAAEEQTAYLTNLLAEYLRNFDARLHIAEKKRYERELRLAHEAPTNGSLGQGEVFERQVAVVEQSLDRLLDLAGGASFEGTAVDPEDGKVKEVTFALVGPVALYRAADGSSAGLAQEMLNSLEPNMIRLDSPGLSGQIGSLVANGRGAMPLDPTLGNAQKMDDTHESMTEHVMGAVGWPPGTGKGGPVMVPIILLAGAATVLALYKLVQLMSLKQPSQKRIALLLDALKAGDMSGVRSRVKGLEGPTGEMLRAGVEAITEPKALVEEVMFEKTLEVRLKLQGLLPFIQVAASAAPLLGLLGTVTGIINTFKLITVFGTGDAKTLSGGISEALITTEFGLIVAIPSLLMHAYLTRKARRMLDGMEKVAVAFLNRVRPEPEIPVEIEPRVLVRDRPAISRIPGMAMPTAAGQSAEG